MPARMMYGIAVHKYIDTMYKTDGHIPTAKVEASNVFNKIVHEDDKRLAHLSDVNHMLSVAHWTWEMAVVSDKDFEILHINDTCWYCKGTGKSSPREDSGVCCPCKGTGYRKQPASEVTYSFPYYQDEYVNVNWCGTMDRIGKIRDGIYVIPDWKCTSSWNEKEYFTQYEMAKSPRGYVLAMKLMAERFPDSDLGKIGAQNIGAQFYGIFIKPVSNQVKFVRSEVFTYRFDEINEFRQLLDDKCREISQAVKTGYYPRQGLINGSCEGKWGKCLFWNVCKHPDVIGKILLEKDFVKKPFNPLAYAD